jgi:hypothetical protein
MYQSWYRQDAEQPDRTTRPDGSPSNSQPATPKSPEAGPFEQRPAAVPASAGQAVGHPRTTAVIELASAQPFQPPQGKHDNET